MRRQGAVRRGVMRDGPGSRAKGWPRGFTLLEVVVVLAVGGLLIAGLAQGARLGLTAWTTQARLDAPAAELEAVDRALRLFVENLSPGDETQRPAINGAAAALGGVTRLAAPEEGMTPIPVDAALALSGDRLVLRWRPWRHGPSLAPEAVREATLMGGVVSLSISYWQPPSGWVSAWTGQELPSLIRIRIRRKDGAPAWPDLVVAPLLARP